MLESDVGGGKDIRLRRAINGALKGGKNKKKGKSGKKRSPSTLELPKSFVDMFSEHEDARSKLQKAFHKLKKMEAKPLTQPALKFSSDATLRAEEVEDLNEAIDEFRAAESEMDAARHEIGKVKSVKPFLKRVGVPNVDDAFDRFVPEPSDEFESALTSSSSDDEDEGVEDVKEFIDSRIKALKRNFASNVVGHKDVLKRLESYERARLWRQYYLSDKAKPEHWILTGNPGTGKTQLARVLASMLHPNIHSKSRKPTDPSFRQVQFQDLIASFEGQTATKTLDVINSVNGGVLFVDEAYRLSQKSAGDYGKQAVDTIMSAMNDGESAGVKQAPTFIFAGYENEMLNNDDAFVNVNPGIRRRVSQIIALGDANNSELMKRVIKFSFKKAGITSKGKSMDKVLKQMTDAYKALPAHVKSNLNYGYSDKVLDVVTKELAKDVVDPSDAKSVVKALESKSFSTALQEMTNNLKASAPSLQGGAETAEPAEPTDWTKVMEPLMQRKAAGEDVDAEIVKVSMLSMMEKQQQKALSGGGGFKGTMLDVIEHGLNRFDKSHPRVHQLKAQLAHVRAIESRHA